MLKVLENHELCSNIMALTAICCIEMGGNHAKEVHVGEVVMVGRQMIAKITFDFSAPPRIAAALPDSDKLLDHIGQENAAFFTFIRSNQDFIKWMRQVVDKMETQALRDGRRFSELSFGDHGAFMDKDNYIVLELQP